MNQEQLINNCLQIYQYPRVMVSPLAAEKQTKKRLNNRQGDFWQEGLRSLMRNGDFRAAIDFWIPSWARVNVDIFVYKTDLIICCLGWDITATSLNALWLPIPWNYPVPKDAIWGMWFFTRKVSEECASVDHHHFPQLNSGTHTNPVFSGNF